MCAGRIGPSRGPNADNVFESADLKLRCDGRFQRAFTACSCVFKVNALIGSNQGNCFENATACSNENARRNAA